MPNTNRIAFISTLKNADEPTLAAIAAEKQIRRTNELFLLFPMGSQFDHLIKQHLDRLGVYCLVADPASLTAEDVRKIGPIGIILSGGPASVESEPPPFDGAIFDLDIPVLGICLGFQMWAKHIGCNVRAADAREFGTHALTIVNPSGVLAAVQNPTPVLQSHGDRIEPIDGLDVLGSTENAPVAAAQYRHFHGVQFHPEVTETECGALMFRNFCFGICRAQDCFPASDIASSKVVELREQIAGKKVLLALSGGSDSSVVAYLLRRALNDEPGRLRAVYIRGIDRPDDWEFVQKFFCGQPWIEVCTVDATDAFLEALAGKTGWAEKRAAMRGVYARILNDEARSFGADFIAQGTLFTDVSESGGGYDGNARKAQIKQHHNVGLGLEVAELVPLVDCVKDGARLIGRQVGVPEDLLLRHPFPGPGLVVRIEGEITRERLVMARALDRIWIEELRAGGYYHSVWQAGVAVTSALQTFTKGDDAGIGSVVVFWAVYSVNGFTASAAEFPHQFLTGIARRMGNEVRGVASVAYRLTGKPPSTIEMG